MSKLILSAILLFSSASLANSQNWCVWDGEEHLKKAVLVDKLHWLQAAYNVHVAGKEATQSFEGVGSCRFVPRTLGETAEDVVNKYMEKMLTIYATRGYISYDGVKAKIVIPSALYSPGTNYLFVKKDFYSMDRPKCEEQIAQTIKLGKESADLGLTDVEVKANDYGVSVIINANSTEANYLGICHFH